MLNVAKDKGYILLWRDIQNNDLWTSEPFSKGQAWVDLLMMASYKEKSVVIGNKIINGEVGSVITSELSLAERWHWNRKRVRRFLALLEDLEMIEKSSYNRGTTLLIKNYEKYQQRGTTEGTSKGTTESLINKGVDGDKGTTEGTIEGTTKGTTRGTTEGTQLNKDKIKINKENNMREISQRENRGFFGVYKNVRLSEEELEKLKEDYPEQWEDKLEALSEYMMTHSKTYKSHYITIKSWIRKDNKRGESDEDKGFNFTVEV